MRQVHDSYCVLSILLAVASTGCGKTAQAPEHGEAGIEGGPDTGQGEPGDATDESDVTASGIEDARTEAAPVDGSPDALVSDGGLADAISPDACILSVGACACPGTQTVCNGTCVDTSTDNANCGGCGATCDGACGGGKCVTWLVQNTGVSTLAVDDTYVYYGTDDGTINPTSSLALMKVPKAGGTPPVPVATQQGRIASIALDATSVYWVVSAIDLSGKGVVMSAPKAGGPPVVIAAAEAAPSSIAVDSANVYWTNINPPGPIRRASLDGGAAMTIVGSQPAGTQPQSLVVAGGALYWLAIHSDPAVVAGNSLLISDTAGKQVTSIESTNLPFALSFDDLAPLAHDAANVYFTDEIGLRSTPLGDPSTIVTIAAGVGPTVLGAGASDGVSVYGPLYDKLSRTIEKISVHGSAATFVASSPSAVTSLAVDDTYVYWADTSVAPDGIMRATK